MAVINGIASLSGVAAPTIVGMMIPDVSIYYHVKSHQNTLNGFPIFSQHSNNGDPYFGYHSVFQWPERLFSQLGHQLKFNLGTNPRDSNHQTQITSPKVRMMEL